MPISRQVRALPNADETRDAHFARLHNGPEGEIPGDVAAYLAKKEKEAGWGHTFTAGNLGSLIDYGQNLSEEEKGQLDSVFMCVPRDFQYAHEKVPQDGLAEMRTFTQPERFSAYIQCLRSFFESRPHLENVFYGLADLSSGCEDITTQVFMRLHCVFDYYISEIIDKPSSSVVLDPNVIENHLVCSVMSLLGSVLVPFISLARDENHYALSAVQAYNDFLDSNSMDYSPQELAMIKKAMTFPYYEHHRMTNNHGHMFSTRTAFEVYCIHASRQSEEIKQARFRCITDMFKQLNTYSDGRPNDVGYCPAGYASFLYNMYEEMFYKESARDMRDKLQTFLMENVELLNDTLLFSFDVQDYKDRYKANCSKFSESELQRFLSQFKDRCPGSSFQLCADVFACRFDIDFKLTPDKSQSLMQYYVLDRVKNDVDFQAALYGSNNECIQRYTDDMAAKLKAVEGTSLNHIKAYMKNIQEKCSGTFQTYFGLNSRQMEHLKTKSFSQLLSVYVENLTVEEYWRQYMTCYKADNSNQCVINKIKLDLKLSQSDKVIRESLKDYLHKKRSLRLKSWKSLYRFAKVISFSHFMQLIKNDHVWQNIPEFYRIPFTFCALFFMLFQKTAANDSKKSAHTSAEKFQGEKRGDFASLRNRDVASCQPGVAKQSSPKCSC